MRRAKQMAAAGMLVMVMAMSSGCLAVAAAGATGAGVAYFQGKSHGVVHAEPDQVLDAARAVLNEWGMFIVEEELDRPHPRLTARTAAGRRVRVIVEPQMAHRTKLWVRYGTFGDRNQSSELYIRIADRAEGR